MGADRDEQTTSRLRYPAGYHEPGPVTRVGKLQMRVPRDREGRLSTEPFARHQRSEKEQVSAPAEMYVQGVSTCKDKAITEEAVFSQRVMIDWFMFFLLI